MAFKPVTVDSSFRTRYLRQINQRQNQTNLQTNQAYCFKETLWYGNVICVLFINSTL